MTEDYIPHIRDDIKHYAPVSEVIAIAEQLLTEARAGRIAEIGAACVMHDKHHKTASFGTDKLIVAVQELHDKLLRKSSI